MSFDTATVLLLSQVISERIDNQEMFTCFDITRILRDRGCTVRHQDVRETIHGLSGTDLPPFRNSGYTRNSMIPVAGYNAHAEVYAHNSDDAYSYDPDALDPGSSTPATPAAPPVTPAVPATQGTVSTGVTTGTPVATPKPKASGSKRRGKIDDKRRFTSRDSRGRVAIHNGFVKSLGLKPGDLAYVSVRARNHPGLVVLTKASRTGHLSTYKVDRSGNIRLSAKTLKRGRVDKTQQFKLRLTDDKRGIIVLQK
jgi:hypothetical protein